MIGPTDLDRSLAAWLAASGPVDVPPSVVESALRAARGRRQHGRVMLVLLGRAWPGTTTTVAMHLRRAVLLGMLALLAVAAVATAVIVGTQRVERVEPAPPIATIAPNPLLERDSHRAIRLDDGRVLVVGGTDDEASSPAALIDPSTGAVTAVAMGTPRSEGSTATLLPDGRVLVAGGWGTEDAEMERSSAAEVFDPASGSFSPVGEMTSAHGPALVSKWFDPVSVVLDDGRVLVIGGTTEQLPARAYPAPGDLFDPGSGTFSATPPLPCRGPSDQGRTYAGQEIRSADLLPDGRVLLGCEGWHGRPGSGSEATVYYALDVDDGTAEPVDVGSSDVSRTLSLADRSVLLWERHGTDRLSSGDSIGRHRLLRYDPRSGSSTALADEPMSVAAVTLLRSGHVLFAGGYKPDRVKPSTSVQVVDPCTGASVVVATLAETRTRGTATQLDGIHVLLVGGQLGHDPNMDQPAAPEVVTFPALPAVDCALDGVGPQGPERSDSPTHAIAPP